MITQSFHTGDRVSVIYGRLKGYAGMVKGLVVGERLEYETYLVRLPRRGWFLFPAGLLHRRYLRRHPRRCPAARPERPERVYWRNSDGSLREISPLIEAPNP